MNHDLNNVWGNRELTKKLGQGPYGEVYLETCRDSEQTRQSAAKFIHISKESLLPPASSSPCKELPAPEAKEGASCPDAPKEEAAAPKAEEAAEEKACVPVDQGDKEAAKADAVPPAQTEKEAQEAESQAAPRAEEAALPEAEGARELSPEERLRSVATDISRRLAVVKAMRGQNNVAFLEDYRVVPYEGGYVAYLRSELLTPLETHLQEHTPSQELALQLCLQISEAIAFYEKKGMLHGNIKPSNLFVDGDGNFKLGEPAFPSLALPENEFAPPEAKEQKEGSVSNELYALCALVTRLFAPKGKLKSICAKACHPDPQKRFRTVVQFQRRLCRLTASQRMVEYTPPLLLRKQQERRGRRALIGTFLLGVMLVICLTLYGRLSFLFLTNTHPGQAAMDPNAPLVLETTADGGVILPSLSDRSYEQVRLSLERLGIKVIPVYDVNVPKDGLVISQSAPADSVLYQTDRLWLLVGCDTEKEATRRIRSIYLPSAELSLAVGESLLLEPVILPAENASLPITWSVSDESVLRLEDGTITALTTGTAILSLRDETGLAGATMTVHVTPERVPIPDLVGKTKKEAEALLKDLELQVNFSYEYHDEIQADVVLAQDPAPDSRVELGTQVQVTLSLGQPDPDHVPVEEVILSQTQLDLKRGDTFVLQATVLPENATNQALSWLSSDRSVATVDEKGTVSAIATGTAVIRAVSADGSKSVSCTVTVSSPSYTVVYEANGGTGTMASSSHSYGVLKKLSACEFTRKGYTFAGWAMSADATAPKFLDGQTAGNLSDRNGDVVHLYAVWTAEEYAVTYATNGGTLEGEEFFFVRFGESYGPLAIPQREGYEFLGWYTDPVYGTRITEDTVVSTSSPATIYARWRQRSVSDYVPVDQLPAGAQVVEGTDYWTYTQVSQQKSPVAVEKEGWNYISTSTEWVVTQENQVAYSVIFPEGFDPGHVLYSRYQAPPAEGESGNRRITYLKTETIGYIYWHWAAPQQSQSPTDAPVSDTQSATLSKFSAFENTEAFPSTDSNGTTKNSLYFANRENQSDGSWWWYRIPVEKLSYQVSELVNVYFYEVLENKTSTTQPTSGINVTHWVQYYLDK